MKGGGGAETARPWLGPPSCPACSSWAYLEKDACFQPLGIKVIGGRVVGQKVGARESRTCDHGAAGPPAVYEIVPPGCSSEDHMRLLSFDCSFFRGTAFVFAPTTSRSPPSAEDGRHRRSARGGRGGGQPTRHKAPYVGAGASGDHVCVCVCVRSPLVQHQQPRAARGGGGGGGSTGVDVSTLARVSSSASALPFAVAMVTPCPLTDHNTYQRCLSHPS